MPGHSPGHVGADIHGEETHKLGGAEQAQGHRLAQNGRQVRNGAHPLRQNRADGEGVILLGDGRAEQAPPARTPLPIPALPIIVALVEIVVIVTPVVTTTTACRCRCQCVGLH
eukprot:1153553-Pelagomonas_calceolata.AAC.4